MISAAQNRDGSGRDSFRPDIEGLRAIAVLAVLLFHLEIAGASGGFVGVDIFFVISGFLIGGIVVREVGEGRFRFSDYLVRRVRRIVPVMLTVLAVVTIAAATLLMPSELADYGWSLGSSSLFMANIHFLLHRGAYAESEHEVLLHMWTLGVEGQFYLLLPLLVLGLVRFGKVGLWVGLVLAAIGSAAVSLAYPWASFYGLPARLWEFLAGMLVAITPLPFLGRRWVREGLALIGLALIGYAIATFTTDTPFPGWRAVLPVAGAAAIVAAGSAGASIVGSVLSLAPVRFVGRISYSLYLWHWPVIVLLLLGLPAAELDWRLQSIATVLSFGLAVLSWRFVEEPFRRKTFRTRPLIAGSGLLTVALLGAAVAFVASGGWPQRFSERGAKIAATIDYPLDNVLRSGTCFINNRSQTFDAQSCLAPADARPSVLLIGDSHAAHLAPGLIANFPGSAVSQVSAAGCRPVIGAPAGDYPFCAQLMGWAFEDYIPQRQPDLVILAGRWEEEDLPALRATLSRLHEEGLAVLLVGPAAEWAQFVPRLLALAVERGERAELPDAMRGERPARLDPILADLARAEGADYVSLLAIQCEPQCLYFGPDYAPTIVDNDHFTQSSSELFTGEFDHPALVRNAP